jgi:Sec-independent protein translocase protein TatA
MEILGIGPLELLFILLIALIILGPGDMVKAGRTLGRILRKIITSSEWRTIQKASQELKYLPNRLMREANIEDLSTDLQEINKIGGQINSEVNKVEMDLSSWTTPPGLTAIGPDKAGPDEPKISTTDQSNKPPNLNDDV